MRRSRARRNALLHERAMLLFTARRQHCCARRQRLCCWQSSYHAAKRHRADLRDCHPCRTECCRKHAEPPEDFFFFIWRSSAVEYQLMPCPQRLTSQRLVRGRRSAVAGGAAAASRGSGARTDDAQPNREVAAAQVKRVVGQKKSDDGRYRAAQRQRSSGVHAACFAKPAYVVVGVVFPAHGAYSMQRRRAGRCA